MSTLLIIILAYVFCVLNTFVYLYLAFTNINGKLKGKEIDWLFCAWIFLPPFNVITIILWFIGFPLYTNTIIIYNKNKII